MHRLISGQIVYKNIWRNLRWTMTFSTCSTPEGINLARWWVTLFPSRSACDHLTNTKSLLSTITSYKTTSKYKKKNQPLDKLLTIVTYIISFKYNVQAIMKWHQLNWWRNTKLFRFPLHNFHWSVNSDTTHSSEQHLTLLVTGHDPQPNPPIIRDWSTDIHF